MHGRVAGEGTGAPPVTRARGAGLRRLLLVALVTLGLAPGTWWRSPTPEEQAREPLIVTPEPVEPWSSGELGLLGAWRLESGNGHFHGYSALALLDDGTLLAASDRGRKLLLPLPPPKRVNAESLSLFSGERANAKWQSDIESLTRDPASGRLWAGYEGANVIVRYERDFTRPVRVAPSAMRDWPGNSGPEAMVRFADGRFVILSEGDPDFFSDGAPGLLFSGDPVEGSEPVVFRFRPPEGFSPVDIAQLPGGRAVILLRRVDWGLPPGFSGKLVVADPATIAPGEDWDWEPLADLGPPLPMDNYEGLAVQPLADGSAALWLISDDNAMRFQRTLLLKLLWRPNEKARGADRAPR
jgi:hypothetical protein